MCANIATMCGYSTVSLVVMSLTVYQSLVSAALLEPVMAAYLTFEFLVGLKPLFKRLSLSSLQFPSPSSNCVRFHLFIYRVMHSFHIPALNGVFLLFQRKGMVLKVGLHSEF